jgi:hypothetical protein
MFDILDGIKFDSLDHHAEIVFNNERQLFSKLYKVMMLNRRTSLLLTIVIKISYCYVLSEECYRQPVILVFILLLLLLTENIKEENKTTHSDIRLLFQ